MAWGPRAGNPKTAVGILYLDPQSMQNNGPKPLKTGQKAIILHTLGGPARNIKTQVGVYSCYLEGVYMVRTLGRHDP